tara:strand:- start:3265 stop:4062 length:798 start_codon:yes stop_codon:yes gene_type:complete
MIQKYSFYIILFLLSYSCSSNDNKNDLLTQEKAEPEIIYFDGKLFLDSNNMPEAKLKFNEVIKLYPLSNEAIQAEIMLGFMDYADMDYESAILKFQRIIIKYPSHKNLDYVYYMMAMCNYERINNEELDGKYNDLALKDFNQVINRYPYSDYAKDSRQKIILINSNKAAKHMVIGRFYLKEQKYVAALNRFKIVIEEYPETKFTPEALHRMVEIYYQLNMYDESKKVAALLGHNFANSEWYEYSYNLVEEIYEEENLLNKIKNFF